MSAAETQRVDRDALTQLVLDAQRQTAEATSQVLRTVAGVGWRDQMASLEKVAESVNATIGISDAAMDRLRDQLQATSGASSVFFTTLTQSMHLCEQLRTSSVAESLRLFADRTEAFTTAQRLTDQFRTSLAFSRLQIDATSFAKPLVEMVAVSNAFAGSLKHLHAALGYSEAIGHRITQLALELRRSTDRHVATVLSKGGWLGIERHLSTWELAKPINVRGRGKGAEIDRRICAAFRQNRGARLRTVTKAWGGIRYLASRRRIIREAQVAHRDRKYALSIAALLPLVDGLAAEIRRKVGITKPVNGKRLRVIAVNDVVHLYSPAQGRSRQWAELVLTVVTDRIFKHYDFDTQRAPAGNNRNGVLHGRIPNYASEKHSLQTFLLLDVMACIAAELP